MIFIPTGKINSEKITNPIKNPTKTTSKNHIMTKTALILSILVNLAILW